MEALLRQRPPPDRNQPRETSPAAIATGKIVKYREKKLKKGDKTADKIVKEGKAQKKAKKSIGEVILQPEPQQVIVTQPSQVKTPAIVVPSIISQKKKRASEPSKVLEQTPSKVMPTPSISSSKRKRGEKEKSSKLKKKSRHHHEVKSRGRSRSRGPAKSHGKRARSLSPSSASEVTTSDSSQASSDDSSDETDSEEEAVYRRRRARSKSRGRQRARSRARSRSRARYSSSDPSGSESGEEIDEDPIFVAFTVPGGKTHMRPIKAGITYPKLLETVYAMSNINQTIPLEISFELNGMTLQLSDEEDLKALLEAATYTKDRREMVRVKVERVESPKPLPVAVRPAAAAPTVSVGAAPSEVESIAEPDKPPKKRGRKAVDKSKSKSKKEEEVKIVKVNGSEMDATTAVNGVGSKDVVSANDSVVSLDTSDDVPLAKVIFKSNADASDSTKAQATVDEPASTTTISNGQEFVAEAPKKKRRTGAEVKADNLMREARKEAVKVEREEKKKEKSALKRIKAKAEKEANAAAQAKDFKEQSTQPKEQSTMSADIPSQAPAPKAIEAPATDKTDETIVKSNDNSVAPKTPKKRNSKKSTETIEPVASEVKEVVDLPSAASEKLSPAKKAKKLSKDEPSPVKESEKQSAKEVEKPEAIKKASKSSRKAATSNEDAAAATAEKEESFHSGSQSTDQTCTICFEKGHSKPYCPIIQGGKESVQQRFDELKAKKQRKTKAENEACKTLQGWLKAEKDHQEQELRFSQKGTLLYTRDQNGGVHANYASEAERLEDEEEKRFMTNVMNKQLEKMGTFKTQPQRGVSPGKGRVGIYDITDKIQRDRSRMAAIGSKDPLIAPVLRMGSPAKANQNSLLEKDQLASSQVMDHHQDQRGLSAVSPTMSESELASSPMLMAGHANGEVQEVTLPSAIENDTSEAGMVKSDGSSDTSDDSDGESDVEQQQEEDEIEEEAELRQEREKSESIASSHNDAEKPKNQSEEEEEVDEIEATPVQTKRSSAPKNSWVASIGSLVGFGGNSQDSQNSASTFNNNGKGSMPAPPSGQRVRPYQGPPLVMASTPVNRRGRPPVGGARLSQLDTSTIKTSYSQPNTPQSLGPSPTRKKAPPSNNKVVEESDSEDSESDSDHETKAVTMPKGKLAGGTKQKKPRASTLAKMTTF